MISPFQQECIPERIIDGFIHREHTSVSTMIVAVAPVPQFQEETVPRGLVVFVLVLLSPQ